jgi:hypothetical protein
VSRNDEANGRIAVLAQRVITVDEPGCAAESEDESPPPDSSPRPRTGEEAERDGADERARLINDIARLIRGPTVPETTRLAGLTLIGWLARRRPEEPAHAVGVEEARKSRRRLQAARAKAR